jgi:dolichyl-phosphate beta-glucosyltransferase
MPSPAHDDPSVPFLSVVIPAYNEEQRVPATIERVEAYLAASGHTWELIVVDDGSKDRTIDAARAAMKSPHSRVEPNPRNMGKGASVRNGMAKARGRYRLFSDADLSTPIEDVTRLLAAVQDNRHDIAIGSRAVEGSELIERQPIYREAMGRVFNLIVRTVALGGIHDTQCGFKLFTARAAEECFGRQKLDGFSFDVEVLLIARRLGFTIAEVPVRWENSPATRVSALRDSTRMFRDVMAIRFREDIRALKPLGK